MTNQPVKRRHVFINKTFQGRFIVSVFMLILLSGLCSALLIYWLTGGDLQAQSQTAHVNIMNAWERLGLSIFIGNLVALFLVGLVSVVVVVYASHKIAGPLYRFETLCGQIGDGQLDAITTLRENDQLQELATAFTEMVHKLRNRKKQQLAYIELINVQIEALKNDQGLTDHQRVLIAKLEDITKKLDS